MDSGSAARLAAFFFMFDIVENRLAYRKSESTISEMTFDILNKANAGRND